MEIRGLPEPTQPAGDEGPAGTRSAGGNLFTKKELVLPAQGLPRSAN